MTRPRLRLTLPPLSPPEALALSYLCSKIDDLLWLHYGPEMVELLNSHLPAPGAWWSTRRGVVVHTPRSVSVAPVQTRPASRGASAPCASARACIITDNEVEQGNVKKRGR
jgi:hypothetical protein